MFLSELGLLEISNCFGKAKAKPKNYYYKFFILKLLLKNRQV